MDDAGFPLDDFTVDFGSLEAKRVGTFDRLQKATEGGSITTEVLEHDGMLYFGAANRNVYCIRPENGELVWKFTADGMIMESMPRVCDGVLYIASHDHNLYALSAKDGRLVWKFETRDKITSTPVTDGGKVLIGSADQNLYCIDRKTGGLVWKFATQGWVNSTPLVVGDRIFFGSYDHFIYCIEISKGRLVWKLETQGEIFNTNPFAFLKGVIYAPSMDGFTRAIAADTGRLLWKTKLANYGMGSAPIIHGGMLLQSTRDGVIYAMQLNGEVVWKFSAKEDDVIGVPAVYGDRIYVGSCADYHLHCLDLKGNHVWKFRTLDKVYAKTTVTGGRIIFASWDCNVYCLDKDTRRVMWKFRAEGSPSTLPPPHEAFELNFDIPEDELGGEKTKEYDLHFGEEDSMSTYKSKMTYRVSSQYAAKGKYQKDSDEEGL
jgi:eukaryotic-like serine/threonine-protein kinase